MGNYISDIAFSHAVKEWQTAKGSRQIYARQDWQQALPPQLIDFIKAQDSFYLATANSNGQPYIQNRGGPKGFLKVINATTLAFADFAGNRQYISAGNLSENSKVHLFLMDYANRRRLKIWGTAKVIEDDANLLKQLSDEQYLAQPERVFLITITAWNLNCPQHITQRYSIEQLQPELERLNNRIKALEAQLKEKETTIKK